MRIQKLLFVQSHSQIRRENRETAMGTSLHTAIHYILSNEQKIAVWNVTHPYASLHIEFLSAEEHMLYIKKLYIELCQKPFTTHNT